MNKHLKQQGFSLVEIMLGAAILIGVGMAAATLFRDQKKAQKKVDHAQDLASFHNQLAKTLFDVKHCTATFKVFSPNVGNISQIYRCGTNCAVTQASDLAINEGFPWIWEGAWVGGTRDNATGTWNSPQIWRIADIAQNPATITQTGKLSVRVTYQMNPSIGGQSVSREIVVNLRFEGGVFRECYDAKESSINSLQDDLCKTMGSESGLAGRAMVWNSNLQRCEPVSNPAGLASCPAGQVPDGFKVNGTVNCVDMVAGYNAGSMISGGTATATGCVQTVPWQMPVARLSIVGTPPRISVVCEQDCPTCP